MLGEVGRWVVSIDGLVGTTITALSPPKMSPAGSTITVRQPGEGSASRATSGAATSRPGGRPGVCVMEDVPLDGSTRSDEAR